METETASAGAQRQQQPTKMPLYVGLILLVCLLVGGGIYFANSRGNGDSDSGSSSAGNSGGGTDATTTAGGDVSPGGQTTTTTAASMPAESPCVAGGNADDCVSYLNMNYHGYDPADSSSPLGVTIRGQPRFEPTGWYYCTTQCFRGQPDCMVTASLLNERNMFDSVAMTPTMPMNYKVGIIFQPKIIAEQITRCSWAFDASSFNRLNGGCGCGYGWANCSNMSMTSFGNICPETGLPVVGGQCTTVDICSCDNQQTQYPAMCYWKGPAFLHNASAEAPADPTVGPDNQIRQMLQQRLTEQANNGTTQDNVTSLKNYWNEITIDGKLMVALMQEKLSQVVAGIMYQRGDAQALGWTSDFNDWFQDVHGSTVPVVALDITARVDAAEGPFFPAERLEDLLTVV